jgi:molybdenum cofactor guanylyltransferase
MIEDVTAFILAGGKSSRMGTDKGLMLFDGAPMITHVINAVSSMFQNVVIITNNNEYHKFGLPTITDIYKEVGPIGGLTTGLQSSKTEWNFFVACDMPFIKSTVIQYLLDNRNVYDAIIPFYQNLPEPLCALYNRKLVSIFESCIAEKDYKIQNTYNKLNYKKVELPAAYFSESNPFLNINSLKDFPNSFNS